MNEYVKVHKIEKYIGRKLPELTIEGMEPTRKRKSAGGKPKGKGGWGDRKSGGWRGDKKPGKEGFGGKSRGEGFKKEGLRKAAKASKANVKPTILSARNQAVQRKEADAKVKSIADIVD